MDKVGEAAKRVGLSVRTLHYYEACGLLHPHRREPSGHRIYDDEDLRLLRQIRLLRSYGLDIDIIRACLRGKAMTPVENLAAKLSALREHIADSQRQAESLECLLISLKSRSSRARSPSEEQHSFELFIDLMSLASEQLDEHHIDTIAKITRELGTEGLSRRNQQWSEIVNGLRSAMRSARPPADPSVVNLARQWHCFIDEAYCGNPKLRADFNSMIGGQPDLCQRWLENLQIDRELLRYLGQASDHLRFDDNGRPLS